MPPGFVRRSADRGGAGLRIAELVGRHQLLIEGGEIRRPFRLAEIDHHGAVLPDIVMVVGIIARAMDEALGRALVEMDVVQAVALLVR